MKLPALPRLIAPFALLMLLAPAEATAGDRAVPALEAQSDRYTIIDGDDQLAGVLSADAQPDIYLAHPSDAPSHIAYIVAGSRIDFALARGESANFAIRFGGRLYPQRATTIDPAPPAYRGRAAIPGGVDVIPFRLGPNNAIHVQGSINGSPPLDLIFDTGASVGVVAEGARRSGARSLEGKTNSIGLGSVVVGSLAVVTIDYRGTLRADGVVGFNAFAGKVIGIDYDRRELSIYHDRPSTSGYRALPLVWRGQQGLIPMSVTTGCETRPLLALLDTGSKWSLTIPNTDPLARACPSATILGDRTGSKSDGVRVRQTVVEAPLVDIGGLPLARVQADLEQPGAASALPHAIAGNDLLKRFNVIIDYRTSSVFIRRSGLTTAPYNVVVPRELIWAALAAGLTAAAAALLWLGVRGRRGGAKAVR